MSEEVIQRCSNHPRHAMVSTDFEVKSFSTETEAEYSWLRECRCPSRKQWWEAETWKSEADPQLCERIDRGTRDDILDGQLHLKTVSFINCVSQASRPGTRLTSPSNRVTSKLKDGIPTNATCHEHRHGLQPDKSPWDIESRICRIFAVGDLHIIAGSVISVNLPGAQNLAVPRTSVACEAAILCGLGWHIEGSI